MRDELRPCIYKADIKALFHCWEQSSYTHGASLLKGGFPAGTEAYVTGIIELENGAITNAKPSDIRFIDSKFNEYCFD